VEGESGAADLATQNEQLLPEERVLRQELGARPQGVAGDAEELTERVTPEQYRDDVERRHAQGSGRPCGARGTRHPRAIGEGSAAVNGAAGLADRRRSGPEGPHETPCGSPDARGSHHNPLPIDRASRGAGARSEGPGTTVLSTFAALLSTSLSTWVETAGTLRKRPVAQLVEITRFT
jgi:hypothetical protein